MAVARADDDGEVGAVFAALADPTRRAVLDAVARHDGVVTTTDLGVVVGVSRQAAAKHLERLAAAGLVAGERAGRERRWRVRPDRLADTARWLAETGAAWDARLARLEATARAPRPDPS